MHIDFNSYYSIFGQLSNLIFTNFELIKGFYLKACKHFELIKLEDKFKYYKNEHLFEDKKVIKDF